MLNSVIGGGTTLALNSHRETEVQSLAAVATDYGWLFEKSYFDDVLN